MPNSATRKLSDPRIEINNETMLICPNSFKMTLGLGEDTVDTVSAGNGAIDIVVGTNVETKKVVGSFEIKNTSANKTSIKNFKALRGELVINALEQSDSEIIRKATLTNDPEWAYSNDTNVTIEFQGLTSK